MYHHFITGLQTFTMGKECTVCFSIMWVLGSEVNECSMDLWRSYASLQLRPLNCAVQHLRELSLGQGASGIVDSKQFTSMLCFLFN